MCVEKPCISSYEINYLAPAFIYIRGITLITFFLDENFIKKGAIGIRFPHH